MKTKIIVFSFAGGSKYSFGSLFNINSNHVVIEYPGRGGRIKEPLISEMNTLIEEILPSVKKEIDNYNGDYAIYGHSLGALIGYLVSLRIDKEKLKNPVKLIVSGNKGPFEKRTIKYSSLTNKQFWERVVKLGGIKEEFEEYPELKDLFIPILKSDFKLLEDFNFNHIKDSILNIPIDVFYGEEDILENEINSWKKLTNKVVEIRSLPGDHFFIFKHEEFFKGYFSNV